MSIPTMPRMVKLVLFLGAILYLANYAVLHSTEAIRLALVGNGQQAGVLELKWSDLMPADYRPQDIQNRYNTNVSALGDTDPRAVKIQQALREAYLNAPVVEALDGKIVKLGGFVVPLEGDGKAISEFLLVPYFGACIHVPPPPPNQIVHVITEQDDAIAYYQFAAVWVTGKLSAQRYNSEFGDVGYTLQAVKVEPYK